MMSRKVIGNSAFVMILLGVAGPGCSRGYSDQKAQQLCEQEMRSKAGCITDTAYAACLACYKECGNICEAQASCPETYQCEE
jgi:hypothetical protein